MTTSLNPNDDHYRLIGIYLLGVIALIVWLFSSCATKKSTETDYQHHTLVDLSERMDSMIHNVYTWQQSVYHKQTALVDSFKHSEVRDTSHTIFLGSKGDTIKEVVKIFIERNINQSTKESEKESWQEMFYRTDSLLQVSLSKQERLDSMLSEHSEETVVEKEAPWYERLWDNAKLILFGLVIGAFACISAFMKKK